MNQDIIIKETHGPCQFITLNRPERLNAFNFELADALAQAMTEVAHEDKIRVVVLRGAGRAFSAGGDIKLLHQNRNQSSQAFKKISKSLNRAIVSMTSMDKITIAAVTGPAYAAGLGVALACDLVVASEDAKLSPSFINIGISPNASSSYFLPRLIGMRRATEAFMRAQIFSGLEAEQIGMINHAWKQGQFEEELQKLIQELVQKPIAAIVSIKKLMRHSFELPFLKQLDSERNEIAASSCTEEFRTLVEKFVNR